MSGQDAILKQAPAQASDPARRRQGYLLLAAVIIFGGMALVLARLAQQEGVPSPVIVLIRLSIAAGMFALPALRHGLNLSRLHVGHLVLIGLAGVFLALHFFSLYYAIEFTTITVASLILLTAPIWVLIAEMTFLKLVPSLAMRYGLVISLFGGVLITASSAEGGIGSEPLTGGLLALLGAVTIALYMFIGRAVRPHIATLPYIWLVYTCAALTAGLVVFVQGIPVTGYTTSGYIWALLLTLTAQIIGQTAINIVLGIFSATFVAVGLRATNVMGIIYAMIVFSEVPGPLQVLGGALILVGVVITGLEQKPSPAVSDEPGEPV